MKSGRKSNIAASVRERLLSIAKARGEELEFVMVHYAVERLLHRLAASPHKNRFILKGAMLMLAWQGTPKRPTRDLDLLGIGEITPESIAKIFSEICSIEAPEDGLNFDVRSIVIQPIREELEYGGLRATFSAKLGTANIKCQVDIGTGDAITPGPETIKYPSLLGMSETTLRAYPKETVIAEKFEAMVKRGIANSRMKDFHDVWVLAKTFAFDADTLAVAIKATFDRRRTEIPAEAPTAFTPEFLSDRSKATQWSAFAKRSKLEPMPTLLEVGAAIATFLTLPMNQARDKTSSAAKWQPGGPWRVK